LRRVLRGRPRCHLVGLDDFQFDAAHANPAAGKMPKEVNGQSAGSASCL